MDLGLKGKKVIMNGGAHGIGFETLKIFAAEGCDVAFFSRDTEKVAAAKAEIGKAGTKVVGDVLDMTDNADGYVAWLGKAVEDLGGCDIFDPLQQGIGAEADAVDAGCDQKAGKRRVIAGSLTTEADFDALGVGGDDCLADQALDRRILLIEALEQ